MSSPAPDSTPAPAATAPQADSPALLTPISIYPPILDPLKHNQVHQATKQEPYFPSNDHTILFFLAALIASVAALVLINSVILHILGYSRPPVIRVLGFTGTPFEYTIVIFVGYGLWRVLKVIVKGAKNADRTPTIVSDSSYRLRIIGHPSSTQAATSPFDDEPFEPIILRSYFAITFVDEPQGLPKITKFGKFLEARSFKTRFDHGQYAAIIHTFCLLSAIAIVAIYHYTLFGDFYTITLLHPFGIMCLHVLIYSLIRPTYIRISPGALDVIYFPALWLKSHRIDRYNLQTSSIIIDLVNPMVLIHDPSRSDRKTIFITSIGLLPRTNLPRNLFAAARSTHPTPPLPADALTG